MKSLEAVARDFTAGLKRQFAEEITRRPRDFKKQVLWLIRRQLPPRRGRPNDPQIDAALAMLRQGKTVRQVLRVQVRGFNQLDTYGRYLAEKALRQAVARRRRTVTSRRLGGITMARSTPTGVFGTIRTSLTGRIGRCLSRSIRS